MPNCKHPDKKVVEVFSLMTKHAKNNNDQSNPL